MCSCGFGGAGWGLRIRGYECGVRPRVSQLRVETIQFSEYLWGGGGKVVGGRSKLVVAKRAQAKRSLQKLTEVAVLQHVRVKDLGFLNPKPCTLNPKLYTLNPKP